MLDLAKAKYLSLYCARFLSIREGSVLVLIGLMRCFTNKVCIGDVATLELGAEVAEDAIDRR